MVKRIISGIVIVALLAVLLILKGVYLQIGIVLMGILCQIEMVNTIKHGDIKVMEIPIYLFSLLLMPAVYFLDITGLFVLYAVTFMIFIIIRVFNDNYTYESITYSVQAIFYPGLFLAFAYLITIIQDPKVLTDSFLITICAASGTDTCAYFAGRAFGKHKLAPEISPNKTVEGALGGFAGGTVLCLLYVLIFAEKTAPFWAYIILAILLSVLSQFGDLAASLAKRYFGVKDFGKIIPGHGGVLDRLCSILFVLPLTYGFLKLFYGI